MARIIIKKGHNIQISGVPSLDLVNAGQTVSVAYLPEEFRYIKPKLLVNEGDTVKIGTPLFFDPNLSPRYPLRLQKSLAFQSESIESARFF